ncbi:MAG: alpha/beta fold hydrolase, partial [Thermomicrobiales bacterium]
MYARFLLALLAVLSFAGAAFFPASRSATASAHLAPTLILTDCAMLSATGSDPRDVIGKVTCGYLDVPENWSNPGERRIRIAWAVLRATSRTPEPDPLVYLAGGPGGSALAEIATYAQLFAPIRKDRDIVLFDQRGAAFSDALRCNDWTLDQLFDLSVQGLLSPAPESVDAGLALPADTDAKRLLDQARKDLGPVSERCAKQFKQAGIDLTQYTSATNASDAVALLSALGYDRFNLYGISYGSRLALTIARDHPESGIRSIVLDSVYPPQINGFEQYPSELPEVANQLFADCRRDAACNAWYPNLPARFAALVDAIDKQPVSSRYGPVDADAIVAVISDLSVNVEAAPYLPRMVAELEQGVSATYDAIVSGQILGYAAPQSPDARPPDIDLASLE